MEPTGHPKYIKSEVWFTPGLLASSRTRSELLTRKLKDPSLDSTRKFNKYNNLFNKIKRSAKIKYYNDTLDKNKFNMKKTWSNLREVIGKKNDKSSFPQEFNIDNEIVTNRANILNHSTIISPLLDTKLVKMFPIQMPNIQTI